MESDPDNQQNLFSDQIGGDKILSGNIAGSVAAIGAGASVIYHKVERALTQIETRAQEEEFESKRLAEALTDYVQRLERQAARAKEDFRAGNPYKALLEFDIKDAALFYGRSVAIHELLVHMERDQLTVLHAGSGTGKTSLLKAGIMPRLLADGHLPLYLRPYQTPVHLSLKQALLMDLADTPDLAGISMHDFLRRATALISGRQFVVIIDQFEELFTVQNEDARNDFVDQLSTCLDDDLLPVRWIITVRDEWFGQLGAFRPRIRNPYANEFLLRPLSRAEAMRVITQPAERREVTYEHALVQRLLDDLGRDEITPPHLQLVCSMLFDSLDEGTIITQTMYDEAGQAKGILREHLYRVLSRDVPREMREPARRLLEALVTSEKRRALRTREELTGELVAWNYPPSIIDKILDQLTDSRLLRVEEFMLDKLNSVVAYELAHDYLLEEIEIDPEIQAHKAAQELLAQKLPYYKREKLLLSPQELAIILPQRKWINFSDEAAAFLSESEAVDTHQRRMRRMGIATALLLLIAAIAAFGIQQNVSAARYENIASTAVAAQGVAETQAVNARSGQIAAAAALSKSLGEVIKAYENAEVSYQTAHTFESRSALYAALSLPLPDRIFSINEVVEVANFSPEGDRMVTVGSETIARIWDLKSGEELLRIEYPKAAITFAAFSPDGAQIITSAEDGMVGIWNAQNGILVRNFQAHEDVINSAIFSPDSNLILTASRDKTAILWDATSGRKYRTLEGHERALESAVFSPDGTRIVTASVDGTVRVWGIDGTEIWKLEGIKGTVERATFSPDGTRIVTASDDRIARILNAETGEIQAFLVPHDGQVTSAEFSQDGRLIMTASEDHLVRLWDADTGTLLAVLPGHAEQVTWATFSLDGNWILTASNDSKIWLRETRRIAGSTSFIGYTSGINSVQFNKDGTRFVTANADFSAWVWDVENSEPSLLLKGHERPVVFATFSPDGNRIATASGDETVRIWNAIDGSEIYQITIPGNTWSVNFSPEGTEIVTSGRDGVARVWDAQTGDEIPPALEGHEEEVKYASYSPDGTRIVTAGGAKDGTVRIWDAKTHKLLKTFSIITGYAVNSASFSPDEKRLVIGTDGGIAEVWDIDLGEPVFQLKGHQTDVRSATYSPDGKLIVTASDDHTLRLWDAVTGEALAVIEGHTDEVRWATFTPDGKGIFSASNDRTVRTWIANFDDLYEFIRDEMIRLEVRQHYSPP